MDQKEQLKYKKLNVYYIQLVSTLGGFYGGMNQVVFNVTQQHIGEYFNWSEEETTQKVVLMQSVIPIGCIAGNLTGGYLLQTGRRSSLILFCIFAIVWNETMLLIGRFLAGFCAGFNDPIWPVYIKEMSPNQMVASGGVIGHVLYSIGCLIPALLALNLPEIGSNENQHWWRIMYISPIIPILIELASFIFVLKFRTPETLKNTKEIKELKQCISFVYKEEFVEEKVKEFSVKETWKSKFLKSGKISLMDTVTTYIKPLLICQLLSLVVIYSGAKLFLIYSNNIFLEHVELETAQKLTNLVLICQLVGVFASFKVATSYGTKPIIIWSCLSLGILCGLFSFLCYFEINDFIFGLQVIIICLAIIVSAMAISPICFTTFADYLPDYGMLITTVIYRSVLIFQKYFVESRGKWKKQLWKELGIQTETKEANKNSRKVHPIVDKKINFKKKAQKQIDVDDNVKKIQVKVYVKKEVKLPEVVEENVQTVFLKKEIIEMN